MNPPGNLARIAPRNSIMAETTILTAAAGSLIADDTISYNTLIQN